MQVRNEFAAVELALDVDGNGPRLRLTDLRSGRVAFLGALELEALAWTCHQDLASLLDPARRWSGDDD